VVAGGEALDDGRIPFRIRVGVTGHRTVEGPNLEAAVREQVRRVYGLLSASHTDIRLSVVSQLADGADRLVVREVLAEARERSHEAHSEVILPLPYDDYIVAQEFTTSSREELDRMLVDAFVQSVAGGSLNGGSVDHGDAYEAAGQQLVARCDVLIALWDGKPSGGTGGTAATLLYAAARSKPCIWVSTEPGFTVRDNLDPKSAAGFHRKVEKRAQVTLASPPLTSEHPDDTREVLHESLKKFEQFNRPRPPRASASRLDSELGPGHSMGAWVAAPFARASTLANRWQTLFGLSSWGIVICATVAAIMLAIALSYGEESTLWSRAEAAFFFLALLGIVVVHKLGVRGRWLTYRVLAEWLRSAHFLAPTGADFRRQARLEGVFVDGQATSWLVRAFEEVWDRRPKPAADVHHLSPERFEALKDTLAEDWIGTQVDYHRGAARRHRRAHQRLVAPIAVLFLATIVFALLHAEHRVENAAIFFSVALPAAGASLGVMLTVNQHQALSQRYARMRSDLIVLRNEVRNATPDSLVKVSSEAARAIALESGGWIGSMWFLDIEHP
jgi:hypothetical protein